MKIRFQIICLLLFSLIAKAEERATSPFRVTGTKTGAGIRFDFRVPEEHVLYSDRLRFLDESGEAIQPVKMAEPVVLFDQVSKHEKKVFNHDFTAEFLSPAKLPWHVTIKFQGCSNSACYFPEKHPFEVNAKGVFTVEESAPKNDVAEAPTENWQGLLSSFKLVGRKTGYLNRSDFLSFLEKSQSIHAIVDDPLEKFKSLSPLAIGLVIILGGISLNLTPCVLPMIPINLAIIGANTRSNSRKRGFMLGGVYGAGMAVIYGALGVFVVLTGSKFGTLQSSVWFNTGIGAIFVLLALGMFDVIDIDFSRLQSSTGSGNTTMIRRRSGYKQTLFAFGLGVIAALLAGACVAPVVISVLLLAANLYGKGLVSGLFLPFLLGLGMALPWPFAGAGLQYLPKPGKWMKRVKQGFGVLILLFAVYYGHLAFNLYRTRSTSTVLADAPQKSHAEKNVTANDSLMETLRLARQEHRPVFIDFGASWCKNCVAMDETVFNASVVTQRLSDFVVVKYSAEIPNEPKTKEVLDRFGVVGLPTYVVLSPEQEKKL